MVEPDRPPDATVSAVHAGMAVGPAFGPVGYQTGSDALLGGMSTSQSSLSSNPTVKTVLTIVGYLFGAVAGVAAIIVGATQKHPGFIVIGVAFLAAVVVAAIAGATAEPRGSISDREISGIFTPPDQAWWVCAGILVVGCVVGGLMLAL